ncbi:DUF4245 domain-containing protein [Gordonia sp. TBRC 11910]|uniref:DUF4245 domain-containing protein n=1 Tax=Gordonia asplenii TaxID=2725283 RepID=A0A848KZY2_9ACTN|nr:DUF4245 domain-containing protein [Gordonia asplenii]NMO02385.1 DUF4245 domain-containing protein [Gordonia asplenii]
MAAKPRILNSSKDMIWSLIPLLLLCVFVVFASQNCSVGLQGNASDDRLPPFELSAALRADADTMPFPIRQPRVPNAWKPNSGTTQAVGDSTSSNVGWITDHGAYIQLTQTAAKEEALVAHLSDRGTDDDKSKLLGSGTHDVDGRTWVVYQSGDATKAWITDLGQVRIALMSKGPDSDLTTLARAVQSAQPLAKRG